MCSNSQDAPTESASGGNVQTAAHGNRKNRCCTDKEREVIRHLNEQRQVAIRLKKQKQKKTNQEKTINEGNNGEANCKRQLMTGRVTTMAGLPKKEQPH